MTNMYLTDPVTFCRNYVQVPNPFKGSVDFNPYPHQEELLNVLNSKTKTMIIQPRQAGVTMTLAAYYVWRIAHEHDQGFMFMSSKYANAKSFLKLFYDMYDRLVKGPLSTNVPDIERMTSEAIYFTNGSWVQINTPTQNVRGVRVSSLLIEQADFIDPYDLQNLLVSAAAFTPQVHATVNSVASNVIVAGMSSYYQHRVVLSYSDQKPKELTLDQLAANYDYAMKGLDKR